MNELQLDDLVYSYPSVDDPNFQDLISRKWEFAELASSVSEPRPERGSLYKHQELIKRFMLFYDRLLINHRTGTGKSCAAFGTAETFKQGIVSAIADYINIYMKPNRTNIKRIYWLTSGKTLIDETKRQLVCKCTNTEEYITEKIIAKIKAGGDMGNLISRSIKRYYSIFSVGAFSSQFRKNYLDSSGEWNLEKIREDFSDHIFIVDEVQYMHPSLTDSKTEKKREIYETMYTIFHTAERIKVMLLTATPMVNTAKEISTIMNLLLPEDKQMPDNIDYSNITLEEIEPYFRGRVSFVREFDTGAIPVYHGNNLLNADGERLVHVVGNNTYPSSIIYYSTTMSNHQEEVYLNNIEGLDKTKNSFQVTARQIANFVFPDGEFGKSAAKKYLIRDRADVYSLNPTYENTMLDYLQNISRLSILSCKFAEIIRLCRRGLLFNQVVYIPNGGFYLVLDKPDDDTIMLYNIGLGSYTDPNTDPADVGTEIPAYFPIVYGGQIKTINGVDQKFGDPDINILATISEPFIQPKLRETVDVTVFDSSKIELKEQTYIHIPNIGFYWVSQRLTDNTFSLAYMSPDTVSENAVSLGPNSTQIFGPGDTVPAWVVCVAASLDEETDKFTTDIRQLAYTVAPFVHPAQGEMVEVKVNSSRSSGSCFVFSDYKEAGAYLLGICFLHQGFEQYAESTSIFASSSGSDNFKSYCESDRIKEREIRLEKKPRFGILSPETKSNVLELFNSYENRYGDYIKVLLGTQVTKAGINLENCMQFHLVGPAWNYTYVYQAMSRVMRSTSHIIQIEEKTQRVREQIRQQLSQEAPPSDEQVEEELAKVDIHLDVDIYLHAAITDSGYSSDIDLYRLIEFKDIPVRRITRFLKQCAIDCQIHRNRNIRPTDVDYSLSCDYDLCDYPCFGPNGANTEPIDFSSFNVLYSDNITNFSVQQILILFNQQYSLSIEEIVKQLTALHPDVYSKYSNPSIYIVQAIEQIIKNKIPLYNRFGQIMYLMENSQQVFLINEYPLLTNDLHSDLENPYLSNSSLSIYSEALYAINKSSIEGIVEELSNINETPLIENILAISPDSEDFNPNYISYIIEEELSTTGQANLLELATTYIIDQVNEEGETVGAYLPVRDLIVGYFTSKGLYFEMNEPRTAINMGKGLTKQGYPIASRGRGSGRPRGRPRKDGSAPRTRTPAPAEINIDTDTPMMAIHIVYQTQKTLTAYARVAASRKVEGRIRIMNLEPDSDQYLIWRDADNFEEGPYADLIRYKIEESKRRFEEYEIYGTIESDGKFRIVDLRDVDEQTRKSMRDMPRGSVCGTGIKMKTAGLIGILCALKAPPPEYNVNVDRNQMELFLKRKDYPNVEDLSTEEVECAYGWYKSDKTNKDLCNSIREFMEENDMIYRVE